MISRSRRKRDGWLTFFRRMRNPHDTVQEFLSESGFSLAINKERCRSERRDLSFCIVRFDLEKAGFFSAEFASRRQELVRLFRRRLRITDEIGRFEGTLGVLLPETIPSHAAKVANDLTDIALRCNLDVSTDILAYPELDEHQPPPNEPGNTGVYEVQVDGHPNSNGNIKNRLGDDGGIATASKLSRQSTGKKPGTIQIRRLNTSLPTPFWKRGIDIVGASAGIVLLSPVFVVTALLVRITSRGPAYFTQWREGKDGQLFRIYKFRTMRQGAEKEKTAYREHSEQDGPAFKIKDDPRLTSIGRFLRKSCVDELPQLLNVLKGEMSLVGPRPLPADESLNCSHWQRRRLDVLPGMTCFWQVQGGRDIPFDEWMRMDLDYVRRRSLLVDSVILLRTVCVTVLHRGSV